MDDFDEIAFNVNIEGTEDSIPDDYDTSDEERELDEAI